MRPCVRVYVSVCVCVCVRERVRENVYVHARTCVFVFTPLIQDRFHAILMLMMESAEAAVRWQLCRRQTVYS